MARVQLFNAILDMILMGVIMYNLVDQGRTGVYFNKRVMFVAHSFGKPCRNMRQISAELARERKYCIKSFLVL